jgi:hypothetical protein
MYYVLINLKKINVRHSLLCTKIRQYSNQTPFHNTPATVSKIKNTHLCTRNVFKSTSMAHFIFISEILSEVLKLIQLVVN